MHSSRMCTGRSLTVCRSLLPGGGCLLPEGGVYSGEGVYSGGGVCSQGGVCSWGVVSQHALRQTPPPPVNRMTDRCKNITLKTTSMRPVINPQVEINFNHKDTNKLLMGLFPYTHTHVTITSVAMDTLRLPVVDVATY